MLEGQQKCGWGSYTRTYTWESSLAVSREVEDCHVPRIQHSHSLEYTQEKTGTYVQGDTPEQVPVHIFRNANFHFLLFQLPAVTVNHSPNILNGKFQK